MALVNRDLVVNNLKGFIGISCKGIRITPREGKLLEPMQTAGATCKEITQETVDLVMEQVDNYVGKFKQPITASTIECRHTGVEYIVTVVLSM